MMKIRRMNALSSPVGRRVKRMKTIRAYSRKRRGALRLLRSAFSQPRAPRGVGVGGGGSGSGGRASMAGSSGSSNSSGSSA